MYAKGGWLDGDDSSSVFIYGEFVSADRAREALAEISQWPLVQGYNTGDDQPIQEIRQEGTAIVAWQGSHRTLTWRAGCWAISRPLRLVAAGLQEFA